MRTTYRSALAVLLLAGCGANNASPAVTATEEETPSTVPATTVPPADEPAAAEVAVAEVAADPAAPSAEARHVDEQVTIVNPTTYAVRVTLTAVSPDRGEATVEIPEIPAGGTGTGTIPISDRGSFSVVAHWTTADGTAVDSRPFTADLTLGGPITPVAVTLSIPSASGRFGVWSQVIWEPEAE